MPSPFADAPEVEARLRRMGDVLLWIVEACPFCEQRHTHGAGPRGGDPFDLLGARMAHCAPDGSGPRAYLLRAHPSALDVKP